MQALRAGTGAGGGVVLTVEFPEGLLGAQGGRVLVAFHCPVGAGAVVGRVWLMK